ncbi:RICIN domain-containing protein [Marisediminicola sp. LYQ85]|uniref:RICIN domain-containing protein n=1 Tax=Marisediminicola sp. LYQ85 TaxID=3391062 RepID=UPI00398325B9
MRPTRRIAVIAGLVVFAVLGGTGASHAYWSSTATTSGTVATGAVGVGQSGFSSLAHNYTASALARTVPVTLTNTGSVESTLSMTYKSETGNNLARAVDTQTWPVAAASACTASAPVPATATASAKLERGATVSATVKAGATAVYCVRTSLTASTASGLSTDSTRVLATMTATLGSWTRSVSANATQTSTDSAAPSAPGSFTASATTRTQTTLSWAASTDNVGVTGYELRRDNVVVYSGSPAAAPSYQITNTSLTAGTTYRYDLRARDAAGNWSAVSTVTITTLPVTEGRWMRLANPSTGVCVTTTSGNDGALLYGASCSTSTAQLFQFVQLNDGTFRVHSGVNTSRVWDVNTNSRGMQLWSQTGGANQAFTIVSAAGGYTIVSRVNNQCVTSTGSGSQMNTAPCSGAANQLFTMTPR